MGQLSRTQGITRALSAKLTISRPSLARLRRRLTSGPKPRMENTARTRQCVQDDDEDHQCRLLSLPYDVLALVFFFLGAGDVARLSQVCRELCDIGNDSSTWLEKARQMVEKPVALVFDEVDNPLPVFSSDESFDQQYLRRALVRGERLRRAWGHGNKRDDSVAVQPVACENAKLASPLLNGYLQLFAADTFLPVPDSDELFDDLCLLSPGDFNDPRRCGKIAFFPQYRPGTHFMTLHQGMMLAHGYLLPHRETCFSYHLAPFSLQSDLPDRTCSALHVKRYHLPDSWTVIEHLIDTKHRRNYALVLRPGSRMLDVVVILDPPSGLTAAFSTSLAYIAENTAAGFRLAYDGASFDVFTDSMGAWAHHSYTTTRLSSLAQSFGSAISSLKGEFHPAHTVRTAIPAWSTLLSDMNPDYTPSFTLLRHWAIPAPVQLQLGGKAGPELFSHILLFRERGKDTYTIVQYFASSSTLSPTRASLDDPSENTKLWAGASGGPHGPATRFSLHNIKRRIMDDHMHMLTLAVSFTHAAWVQCVTERVRFPYPHDQTHSVLKIVQFPEIRSEKLEAGADKLEEAQGRELDVPSYILENSFVIYLEPALASVFVLTNDSVLRKFQFA